MSTNTKSKATAQCEMILNVPHAGRHVGMSSDISRYYVSPSSRLVYLQTASGLHGPMLLVFTQF